MAPAQRISAYRAWQRAEPLLFIAPALLTLAVFLGYPLAYNFWTAFFRVELGLPGQPFVGLDNFIANFEENGIGLMIWNSALWTVAGVGLQFACGLSMAVLADRLRNKAASVVQTVLLLPWVIPGVVTSVIWMCMLQSDLGVVNFLLGRLGIVDRDVLWLADGRIALFTLIVVNTWKAAPFWFLMMTAAMLDVPKDQLEAAQLDGAGFLRSFYHVVWQHLKPVVMATLTLTTIWTFNGFDLIYTMTKGGPLHATSTLPYYTYVIGFKEKNYGQGAALAVFSILIVGAVCFPYIRAMLRRLKEGE
jgi:multiple sugar transport system permease protein